MPDGNNWLNALMAGIPPINAANFLQEWWRKPPGTNIFGRYSNLPTSPITPYAANILQQTGGIPAGTTVAPESQAGVADRIAAMQALKQTTEADTTTGMTPDQFVRYITEGGYMIPVYKDASGNEYTDWSGALPLRETPGQAEQPTKYAPYGEDPYSGMGQFNPYTGEWEPTASYGEAQRRQQEQFQRESQQRELATQRQMQDQMIQWYQQQAQMQAEQQKQQLLANLRANPASWLEYAAQAGTTPTVQPWMVPLGQAGQGLRAGEPLPGYSAQGNSMNLPELTTPSAQYLSRIAPSARQQYAGYEKARTGANPEDIMWMLGNQAPPGGQYSGLRRLR